MIQEGRGFLVADQGGSDKGDGYAALFNCTPVDRASDSMMAPT